MRPQLGTLILALFLTSLALAQPQVKTETISAGKGPAAQAGDEVVISYKVSLPDGTLVEKTEDGSTFKVKIGSSEIIPGLSQGLVGIQREESRRIEIPAELAYGALGSPPTIPPNSPLIFEVTAVYRSSHSHDDGHGHDDDGHEHEEEPSRDGSRGRTSAEALDRPAISEFLIRDFYTKPWRYDSAPKEIWRKSGVLTGLSIGLLLIGYFLSKRANP